MSFTHAGVIAAGLLAIAWVNWFFFLAGKRRRVAKSGAEVRINVRGGYDPATMRGAAGKPVRLEWWRVRSRRAR